MQLWTADRANLVSRMTDRYERWARKCLSDRSDAAHFARFLRKPGAGPLLRDGLGWLADADPPDGTARRGHDDYEDALGSLLDQVLRDAPEIPRSSAAAGDAYRKLLQRLADRQVPIALELMSRLSSAHS